jgi:mycobactin peptide synthetase MbtF
VLLNYLGRADIGNPGQLRFAEELSATAPITPEPNLAVRHELTLAAGVMRFDGPPRLVVQWRTLPSILTATQVEELQGFWQEALRELAAEVGR